MNPQASDATCAYGASRGQGRSLPLASSTTGCATTAAGGEGVDQPPTREQPTTANSASAPSFRLDITAIDTSSRPAFVTRTKVGAPASESEWGCDCPIFSDGPTRRTC